MRRDPYGSVKSQNTNIKDLTPILEKSFGQAVRFIADANRLEVRAGWGCNFWDFQLRSLPVIWSNEFWRRSGGFRRRESYPIEGTL
jgi:hypothetical protein